MKLIQFAMFAHLKACNVQKNIVSTSDLYHRPDKPELSTVSWDISLWLSRHVLCQREENRQPREMPGIHRVEWEGISSR